MKSPRRPALGMAAVTVLTFGACLLNGSSAITLAQPVRPSAGTTYHVNSTADTIDADPGVPACADAAHRCSLRAAVMQANFHVGPDTIVVPAGTYTLRRPGDDDVDILGDLDITDSLTIKGASSSTTVVNGNGSVTHDRVFQVLAGAKDVTISGLTIRGGVRTASTFDEGGGLLWQGGGSQLHLRSLVIEHNKATYLGGLGIDESTMGDSVDLDRVTAKDNAATAAAGGVGVNLGTYGELSIRNSKIHDNTAYEAAGLYLGGDLGVNAITSPVVSDTQIYANHASGLSGGVENWTGASGAPVLMIRDGIHDNTAGYQGGGMTNHWYMTLSDMTFASNSSPMGPGGGIYADEGSVTRVSNVTFDGNTAYDYGGGVYAATLATHSATVYLTNVTMTANSAGTSGGAVFSAIGSLVFIVNTLIGKSPSGGNCNRTTITGTYSLADDSTCGFGTGDGIADLMLGPLGDHGGATRTRVPQAGSPAIDAGTNSFVPADDQRGIPRPQNGLYDIGAVEVCQTTPTAPALVSPAGPRVAAGKVVLDWTDVPCIQGYSVLVKLGSRSGRTVQTASSLDASTFTTIRLAKGKTYYWRVTVIGDSGRATSAWWHFKAK